MVLRLFRISWCCSGLLVIIFNKFTDQIPLLLKIESKKKKKRGGKISATRTYQTHQWLRPSMDRVSTHRWEYPRSRAIYTQAWKIERPRDPLFSCFCSETLARRRPFTRSLDSLSREWDRPIRLRGCRVNGQVGFDQKSLFEFGDSLKSISSFQQNMHVSCTQVRFLDVVRGFFWMFVQLSPNSG